jgi:hypothetical protein
MTDLAPKIEDKPKVRLNEQAEVKPQSSTTLLTWLALLAAALLTVIYGRSVVFNIGGGVLGGGIDATKTCGTIGGCKKPSPNSATPSSPTTSITPMAPAYAFILYTQAPAS